METKSYKDLFKNGYNFHFDVDGHHIHCYGSINSGKEILYIDEQVISEKRTFRRKSVTAFEIDNNNFEVEYNMVSMLKGELHCTLIKNGVHVETQIMTMSQEESKGAFWVGFWSFFAIGAIVGFFGATFILNWLGL